LILTESLPKSTSYEYVTLSYCWGVADTLADVVGDGGTITCLRWIKWCDPGRNPINYEKAGHHRKVTGAIVVTPVDLETKTKTYRRTGWLEVVDDEFFRATR